MDAGTVIIGAGQAGLALSRHLAARGLRHVVLERGEVGERWRSERWDALRLLTPNWLNRLPFAPPLPDPDGYLDRRGVIRYLERYAARAPVHEHTAVHHVGRADGGFRIATDRGTWLAGNVVIATGECDVPHIPAIARDVPPAVHALHAASYRRPADLPEGGVLVVGAGPSGQQLAAELRRAGRHVVLAAGRHARMPRTYRGRDVFWWLDAAGLLDVHADDVPDLAAARRAPNLPVSGARGGEALGLDGLAALGVVVTGRLRGIEAGQAEFARDLEPAVRDADRRLRRTLARIDAHIARTGTPAPPGGMPPAFALPPAPARLELGGAVRTVLWATGYRRAYPWLDVPVLDAAGEIVHREGVTAAPGLFVLGLRFQRTRRSSLLGGVGDDAAHLAAAIAARSEAGALRRAA